MRSTFFGIEMGKRAVSAYQYSLDVTGHNVSNADTAGYTRQTPVLVTTPPLAAPQKYNLYPGQLGTGVEVEQIKRLRDQFADLQFRNENTGLGIWEIKQETLTQLEAIINEPTDDSLQSVLGAFWKAMQNLSQNPEQEAVRRTVRESAQAVTDTIQHMYQQLKDLRDDLNSSVKNKVDEVNSIARQIADLNDQILAVTIAGLQPNDLMDKRDLLIDQLSYIVDIEVIPEKNNVVSVLLGGTALVEGNDYAPLAVKYDTNGLYKVVWAEASNFQVVLEGGSLQGLLESRGICQLDWNFSATNIRAVESHFKDKVLNYSLTTETADDDQAIAAGVSRLYEYSQYSGSLIPADPGDFNVNRSDINGQILFEVISKNPTTNDLTIRYTTDLLDRVGNHYTNTGIVTLSNWSASGVMSFTAAGGNEINLDGTVQTMDLTIDMTNGSADFTVGDKFVLGLTAGRLAGVNNNDGLNVKNMDSIIGGQDQKLQYWFNDGVLTANRKLILGTFALDQETGEVHRNQDFTVYFSDQPLRDGTASLENRTGKSYREIYSQAIVNPYMGLVPTLMDSLNTLAKVLTEETNAVHRQGYNLNYFPDNTNINFFKDFGDEPVDFEWAANITLADEILDDLNNIAAASSPTRDSSGNRINFGDGGNALKLAQVKQKLLEDLGDISIDDYWRSITSGTGVLSQQATRMASNQEILLNQIENKRQSVSGVSLDEEMTNMIKYQHAYNAAARYITTIDESLEIIISRMGLVGRS